MIDRFRLVGGGAKSWSDSVLGVFLYFFIYLFFIASPVADILAPIIGEYGHPVLIAGLIWIY